MPAILDLIRDQAAPGGPLVARGKDIADLSKRLSVEENADDGAERETVVRAGWLQKRVLMHRDGRSIADWAPRFVQLTKSHIKISLEENGRARDWIELTDIDLIKAVDPHAGEESMGMGNHDKPKEPSSAHVTAMKKASMKRTSSIIAKASLSEDGAKKVADNRQYTTLRLYTEKYGRNYYIRAETPEECAQWLAIIEKTQEEAQQELYRSQVKTCAMKARIPLARLINSDAFQCLVAACLFANFALNILETEVKPGPGDDMAKNMHIADLGFTAFYTLELGLNLFVNWWRPFFNDGWSIFDAVCVISGLVGELVELLAGGAADLTMIRSLRIFKIVRIFNRLKSLQRIILSIASTLVPLLNTFMIYFVVTSIYAVLATQLFGSVFMERFGSFTKASLALFQISTGDSWLTDVLRPLLQRQGLDETQEGPWSQEVVWSIIFFTSYILFVNTVLVNVAVAVLLEGFLSSIAMFEMHEQQRAGLDDYNKHAGDLDPLLATLSTYRSEEHLSSMIHRIFMHLDVDDSDSISFAEFKEGLERLDIEPSLYITDETFDTFTHAGAFCDDENCLTYKDFEVCMRKQLCRYAQQIVAHQMSESIKHSKDTSAEFFAQKVLMTEIFNMSQNLCPPQKPANAARSPQNSSDAAEESAKPVIPEVLANGIHGHSGAPKARALVDKIRQQNADLEESLLQTLAEYERRALDAEAANRRLEKENLDLAQENSRLRSTARIESDPLSISHRETKLPQESNAIVPQECNAMSSPSVPPTCEEANRARHSTLAGAAPRGPIVNPSPCLGPGLTRLPFLSEDQQQQQLEREEVKASTLSPSLSEDQHRQRIEGREDSSHHASLEDDHPRPHGQLGGSSQRLSQSLNSDIELITGFSVRGGSSPAVSPPIEMSSRNLDSSNLILEISIARQREELLIANIREDVQNLKQVQEKLVRGRI